VDAPSLKRFLAFQIDWSAFSGDLEEITNSSPTIFRQPGGAFVENLRAVVLSISLPAQLISRVQQGLSAHSGLVNFERIMQNVIDDGFFHAATELLRQGTVLTWSALEVLCNDLFVQLLNFLPDLSLNLLEDEKAGKRFSLKSIPIKTVHDFGYDLSKKTGILFTQRQSISSTEVMRDVFDVLCSESQELRNLLLQDRLWLLNQRRNLIVHKRAVVDEFYLSVTGEKTPLGSALEITVTDIETDLQLVRNVGIELLKALPARLKIIH
jgi:hypothetical protein